MRLKNIIPAAAVTVLLLTGCTVRRTDSKPEADGDTIEVTIPDNNDNQLMPETSNE